jgi:hypothetical protein
VGNEENEYPVPDPNRLMTRMSNELNDTHEQFLKRNSRMSSLSYSVDKL